MRVSKLVTKTGQQIELGGISILVGANNVGKSQTLMDIKDRMVNGLASKPVIFTEIQFEKPEKFETLFDGLELKDHPTSVGTQMLTGINSNLTGGESLNINKADIEHQFNTQQNLDFLLGNISKLRLSFLDASSRLIMH